MQQILINGAWVDAREGPPLEIVNPATLERLGTVANCGARGVALAVGAAGAALPGWHALGASQRASLLREIAVRVRTRLRELAKLLTEESGKPLCESSDCVEAVAALFEGGAALAESGVAQAPAGVVAAITPFNFPLLFMASAIASTLAAGRTIVCKPAQQNPLACLRLVDSFQGLPAGVINLVTGGPDTGAALATHPDITHVKFTGSVEVGTAIAAAATTSNRCVELELGCVGALVVCRDADLDVTVPALAWARLFNGGQVCTSGKHIYVERSIAADFVERMHQCIGFLDVDNPLKRPTDLGPLISLASAHRVEDQVGRALREGAKLILGGRRFRPSGLPGHFFQPTILADVPEAGVPVREEILGPVVTVTPFADLPEAILRCARAPRCPIALYTGDPHGALRLLKEAAAREFRINGPSGGAMGPFGGIYHGEVRRLLDAASAHDMAVSVERKAWWFPYRAREIA